GREPRVARADSDPVWTSAPALAAWRRTLPATRDWLQQIEHPPPRPTWPSNRPCRSRVRLRPPCRAVRRVRARGRGSGTDADSRQSFAIGEPVRDLDRDDLPLVERLEAHVAQLHLAE